MSYPSGIPTPYPGTPTNGTSEVQTLTIGGSPTTGTFKIAFNGFITAAITWSATNGTLLSNLNTALRALKNINGAHITATAGSLSSGVGTVLLTFSGNLAVFNVPLMTIYSNGLDGGGTLVITTSTAGVTATLRGAAVGALLQDTTTGRTYINGGTVYAPLWSLSQAYNSFGVLGLALGSPALGAATAVHAAVTDNGSPQTITTALTNPDVPRVVTATAGGTSADVKAIQVIVTGTDASGAVLTETLPAFTVNTTGIVTGSKAFKTVTSVLIPAHDGTGATTAIGTGAALGIGLKLNYDGVLKAYLAGVKEATAPAVATSSTVLASNTVSLNSALNGSAVALYVVNDVTA